MEAPATRTVRLMIEERVLQYWNAEIEVPEQIKTDAEVKAYIEDNMGNIEYMSIDDTQFDELVGFEII